MLVSFMFTFIAGLLSLPLSGARSLSTVNVDIGQISAGTGMIARQATGTVPAQCTSMCDPVTSQLASVCTAQPEMCCTATFETQYFNCVLCVGNADGIPDYTAPQALFNSFRQQCASAGLLIPALVFPGQSTAGTGVSTSFPSSSQRSLSMPAASVTTSASGIPTLPVPSPTTHVSQQTITSLSSTAGTTGTTGAPASSSSALRVYGISPLSAVMVSFFMAAWHLA